MAFDLNYILTPCDHRIRHSLIAEASSETTNLIMDTSRFGISNFGTGQFGVNTYAYVDQFGAEGTYINNTDGTVTAIFPVPGYIAGDPKLFAQVPGTFNREAVPAYSKNSNSEAPYLGDILYIGDDTYTYFGGSATPSADVVVPVWYIAYTPTAIGTVPVPANSLVINRYDNMYELYLDYNIQTNMCPFCHGTGVRNDLCLTQFGRISAVTDTAKLTQQVLKSILTPKSKNPFFPAYGSTIPTMIGDKSIDGFSLRDQIVQQLTTIKQQQQQVLTQNPGFFTARELLDDLIGVQLVPQTDPRVFGLTVSIVNKALEQTTSKTITIS